MNISNLFETRDKTYLNLLKGSVYLGRVIRENVVLFDTNIMEQEAMFLTESDKIIKVKYDMGPESISFTDVNILGTDNITSDTQHNDMINEQIKSFITDVRDGNNASISKSFDNVLSTFDTRIRLEQVKNKLSLKEGVVKTASVNKEPFMKLFEVKDLLKKFFKVSEGEINEKAELIYDIKLANAISKSLDVPEHMSIDDLQGKDQLFIKEDLDSPLFDIVCRQEFLKRELFESKNSLYSSWVESDLITELITHVVEEDPFEDILEATVIKFPYFAFLSKKDVTSLVESYFTVKGEKTITKKKLNELTKNLFESKKAYKTFLVNVLNEKYGVSLSHIKETPSLKELGKLQYSVLTELSKLSTESSVLKDILLECAKEVRGKGGVDLLFVNDLITSLLSDNEIAPSINENHKYLNLDAIKQDLLRIKGALGGDAGMPQQGMEGEMPEEEPTHTMPDGTEMPDDEMPEQGMEDEMPDDDMGNLSTGLEQGDDDVPDNDAAELERQGIPPEEAPMVPGEEQMEPGMEQEMEPGMEEEMPEEGMPEEGMEEEMPQGAVGTEGEGMTNPEEIKALVKDIEELLGGIGDDGSGIAGGDVKSPVDEEEKDIYDE